MAIVKYTKGCITFLHKGPGRTEPWLNYTSVIENKQYNSTVAKTKGKACRQYGRQASCSQRQQKQRRRDAVQRGTAQHRPARHSLTHPKPEIMRQNRKKP